MLKLVLPHQRYRTSYLTGLREYHAEGFLVDKIDYKDVEGNFIGYVRTVLGKRTGQGLPPGYVPETELWLVDKDAYIGTVKIRHTLNEYLSAVGGHIGYYIVPSRRGRGYGKRILAMTLPEARKIGLGKILITCDETNHASKKIIEAAGGIFEGSVPNGIGKPLRLRYWLAL